MRSFPLELVDGHALVQFPDGLALVDTGSPLSIEAPAIVSHALGRSVRRLVGIDVLRRSPILLDYAARRYVERPRLPFGGQVIKVEPMHGVFTIAFEFGGRLGEAFLDTGCARVSYCDPAAVAGMTPCGVESDFHPAVGMYEVPVYDLTVVVAGRQLRGHFGVLPEPLRSSLPRRDLWIIGEIFWRDRRIVLDLARNRIIDVTDVLSPNDRAPGASGSTDRRRAREDNYRAKRSTHEKMHHAYHAAQLLIDAELSPSDRGLLERLSTHDVVVVRGHYDRVEDVLRLARIPFNLVDPTDLERISLTPRQLVIINCPGRVSAESLKRLRAFVEEGGSLVTTDWALTHVIERAFPGFIEYNHRSTGDEVVRLETRDTSNPWLAGMFSPGADPLWWLEGASYPIRVLDHERVRILLSSQELAQRWGESPVAIGFDVGRGDVLHMISHYYLQRTELRTARHHRNWKSYAGEVGASGVAARAPSTFDDLSVGEVESAHKSLRFVTNMVLEKQRKGQRR